MIIENTPINTDVLDNGPGDEEATEAIGADGSVDKDYFIKLAHAAFQESETFIDQGHRTRWARNNSLAKSEHPAGSKYYTPAYAHRSRAFRGKTEGSLRKNEAALGVSMFSNRDVVSITAENADDEDQDRKAKAIHRIVNYRLDKPIKWFMTAIGAYHEAMINGDVVSEQFWDYEKLEDGTVSVNKPQIDLYPLEHVHASPSADWRDPINTSPYLVLVTPTFICDAKRMMVDKQLDDLDPGEWITLDDSTLLASKKTFKHDEVQKARTGKDVPTKDDTSVSVTGFELIYIHKNIIKVDGVDMFYYTAGTTQLLSKPIPLTEQYLHIKDGERPFVWGTATIEPHKIYRRSLVDRVAETQIQSNDIANQRFDNVTQVLNKRKLVKRGMNTDYTALIKNIPGSNILTDDPNSIIEEPTTDITGSSVQEQFLINADYDDLAGSFSNSSVSTDKSMGDTLGGMQLLKGNANTLTEYQLRVFVETWVEPVIRQVVDMVIFYEDDDVIAQVTGGEFTTNKDLQIAVDVRVSVGFGSTDPQQNVNKIVFGTQAIAQNLPKLQGKLDESAIAMEIFSALGFNDGTKFLPKEEEGADPEKEALIEQLQQMQQVIESGVAQEQAKAESAYKLEQLKQQGRAAEKQADLQETYIKIVATRQLELTKLALDNNMKTKDMMAKVGQNNESMNLEVFKESTRRVEADTKKAELDFKKTSGRDGI